MLYFSYSSYTASEIAESAHIPGKEMVKMDGKMAMVVLPAPQHVNFDQLKKQLGVSTAELATESEFQGKSPGCEVGAMPPFGNLYGMDIHVSKRLTEDKEIAFNAGFPYGIDKTLVQGF